MCCAGLSAAVQFIEPVAHGRRNAYLHFVALELQPVRGGVGGFLASEILAAVGEDDNLLTSAGGSNDSMPAVLMQLQQGTLEQFGRGERRLDALGDAQNPRNGRQANCRARERHHFFLLT